MSKIHHLSTNEAAKLTKIPKGTFVTWRYDNKGPVFVKKGALVFYSLDELYKFLESGLQPQSGDFTPMGNRRHAQYTLAIQRLHEHFDCSSPSKIIPE